MKTPMATEQQLIVLREKLYVNSKRESYPRYRQEDGAPPENYQRGCTIVVGKYLWRWNKDRHAWEEIKKS